MVVPITKYFKVLSGTNLELVDKELDPNGINFVSRTSKNNGVVARIKKLNNVEPNSANTISVALSGSVMESFLQKEPYYSSYHLCVLEPLIDLSDNELLYYCLCIRTNKYKYNYGRQADKSIKNLTIPSIEEIPSWVERTLLPDIPNPNSVYKANIGLFDREWKWFKYQQLFTIERGIGARKDEIIVGGKTPLVTSIDSSNGIVGYVNKPSTHQANTITVNRNGSVGQAYYQPRPFCSTEDVHVFVPLFTLNKYSAMFLLPLIMKEKFRYSYGRKWGIERMKITDIRLPSNVVGEPDWQFMADYIKSLPYSSHL